jgi:predicted nucleic acid binding AN1-type Zn finger protein
MPCRQCKKKCGVPMVCKYCNGEFCMKCFRLEQHNCIGVEMKKMEQLKDLEKKLDFKPECKYAFLR